MKMFACLFIGICLIAVLWGMADARINPANEKNPTVFMDERPNLGSAAAVEDAFFNDLHIGALWFPAISNKGYVGYSDLSAYYPGGGTQTTVWSSGMWAGGYVDDGGGIGNNAWRYHGSDGHHSDPEDYDTLDEQAVVKTETDLGYLYPYRRMTVHVNTAAKPLAPPDADPVDALDGDMGLDVTYEWHQWGVRSYDNWVFVHVRIEFSKPIEDFYWGWMSDCDVGDVNVPNFYFDDYAGWDDSLKFCYMRDWDCDPLAGQPPAPSTEDSVFLSPDAVGQYLLAAPPAGGPITADPDPTQLWVTKNYWDWNNDVSSVQNQYDRLAGIWENPFPPLTEFDYRILNGVGPYDVSAGDTAHFWMAYVLGEGYDEDSHATYALGTLVDHVQDARAFFDAGMVIPVPEIPPQAPDLNPDLGLDIIGDTLRIHWAPYTTIPGGVTADVFFVYRSVVSGLGPWERIAVFTDSVTETQVGLTSTCTYFWVEAYDTGNQVGSNPYALSSRLYERDTSGILRANHNTIVCAVSPYAGVKPEPLLPNTLSQNYPNPFNTMTTIAYSISSPGEVNLRVYDVSGRLVKVLVNDLKGVGEYRFSWDGRDRTGMKVPSGVYFLRLEAGGQVDKRTVILLE
ncbi:MAG: T9SS type A sorting domain-containing protein [Candidatus Eisenbacteria bacterium]